MGKVLCIGDIHIKVDNLALIDLLEQQIKSLFTASFARDIELIVVLGDILHTHERVHTLALNRAHNFIEELASFGDPVIVLVGNHDYIQNDQFLTKNHWMNGMKWLSNVYVIDDTISSWAKDFAFCPYVPVGRFREALDTADFDWKKKKVIFAHQEFEGAIMNHGIVSSGDPWDKTLPMIISGHIHGRQDLHSGVHYVGAALPGNEGTSMLTLYSPDTNAIEAIPLKFPKRNVIRNITADQAKIDSESWDLADLSGVVIRDTFDNFKSFQKHPIYSTLVDSKVKVTFKVIEEAPIQELIDERAASDSFEQLLMREVLSTADEYLYAASEKILNDKSLEETDFIVVRLNK
jgi:predicted phosphodiesterase